MNRTQIKSIMLLLFFSFNLFAAPTEDPPNDPEIEAVIIVDEHKEKIAAINLEIKNLESLQKDAKGQEKFAMQLSMFKKNLELRKAIGEAIADPNADKEFLIKEVQLQQKYAKLRIKLLSKRASELVRELGTAENVEKLALATQYQKIREFLDGGYQETAENLSWLNLLLVITEKEQQAFKEDLTTRLEQISANIEFLQQREGNQNAQLQDTPEAEKENINLSLNVTRKQIDIDTASLQVMMKLADNLSIDTAKYKRLYFDATGSVTQDLLNKDVLSSIISDWTEQSWAWTIENTPRLLFQLFVVFIILFTTYQIASITKKVLTSMLATKNLHMSQLMQDFFISMSGRAVWVIGFLIALSQMGINLGPVLAGFGVAGVIIGFALQDTLSNFAAGMMLLIYRPFDVGDFVYAGGVNGKVSHMSLVNTTIKTFDNQIIMVPNSKIWGDVIKNVTHERVRRVDMEFGVSYNDDIELVEKTLLDIITNHPAVLRAPEPAIKVGSLGDSSVNFLVRPWTRTDDYWDVYWDVTKEVKIRFDKEGICIPYPQQDVHFYHGVEKAPYLRKPDNPNPEYNQIVKQ